MNNTCIIYYNDLNGCRLESLKKDEELLAQELKDAQMKLEENQEAISLIEKDLRPL